MHCVCEMSLIFTVFTLEKKRALGGALSPCVPATESYV
jgi:hypothetical protein